MSEDPDKSVGDEGASDVAGAAAPANGVRARARLLRQRARDGGRRMQERRTRSGAVDVGLTFYERDRAFLGGLLAGALAFRLFLFLVPFTLVTVAVLDIFLALQPESAGDFVDEIGLRASLLENTLDEGGGVRGGVVAALVIGMGAALYTSVGAVRALWLVYAVAWGLDPTPPRRIARTAVVFFLINIAILGLPFAAAWLREATPGVGLAATFLVVVVYAAFWLGISAALPHGDVRWTYLLPGALLVAVGGQILHLVSVFYLAQRFDRFESVYGAIGAAAVVLLWLYLIARLMVAGASLNAVLASRRSTGSPPTPDGHDTRPGFRSVALGSGAPIGASGLDGASGQTAGRGREEAGEAFRSGEKPRAAEDGAGEQGDGRPGAAPDGGDRD